MFQGDVLRECSNNLSPSKAVEVCLDRIQRMTVFEFSDMSSALAQESSTSRQGMAFLFPYFQCKKKVWVMAWWLDSLGRGKFSCLVVGSLSFSVKNHSRLSKCRPAFFCSSVLTVEMLGRTLCKGFLALFVAVSGRICFLFEPRNFSFFFGEVEV